MAVDKIITLLQFDTIALTKAEIPRSLPPLLWCHQCKCQHSKKKKKLFFMSYHFDENSFDLVKQQKRSRRPPQVPGSYSETCCCESVSFIISYTGSSHQRVCYVYLILSNSQSTVHSKYILADDANFVNPTEILFKGLWKIFSMATWSACSTSG